MFQLQRTMGTNLPGGAFPSLWQRPNLVGAVYLNGITQNPAAYSVDPDSGLVTFATPPGSGLIITADFTYYFRCRFIDDQYDFENFMYRLWH